MDDGERKTAWQLQEPAFRSRLNDYQ